MRALNIIKNGYRATLEEQDDTIVWLSHAMKGAGAELDVLLRGSAVNYGVKAQDASGLSFGDEAQTRPPDLAGDLVKLHRKGVRILVLAEDLDRRGIDRGELIEGLTEVAAADLPGLFEGYDQIWSW